MTRQTTVKDRCRTRVLFSDARLSKPDIHRQTGFTMHSIRTVIQPEKLQPRSGRPPTLNEEEVTRLIDFVKSSFEAQQMSYLDLAVTLSDNKDGEYATPSALRRHGMDKKSRQKLSLQPSQHSHTP